MKKFITYIILIVSFYSCEEAIDWEQKSEFTPRLVVDALITNKTGYSSVDLSFPVTQTGESPRKVSNAFIGVSSDGVNFDLFSEDPVNPGSYSPDNSFRAVINQIYYLYISIDEFEFSARTIMVPVEPLKNFFYYGDNQDPEQYRIVFPQSNSPSMIRYVAEFSDIGSGEMKKSIFYHYNLSTIDVNEFFKPTKESLSFPAGTRIIRMKYSLAPDHEKFIRSLLSETEWKGGWFDVMPGNLHTNLSTGGVGYFGASSLVIDTVYFE